MSDAKEKLILSWDEIHDKAVALAGKIRDGGLKRPRILAVTRGGLFPAMVVARELDIKIIETIGIEAYTDDNQLKELKPLKEPAPDFLHDTLIIEDLTDTGTTLRYIRERAEDCVTAAIYAKPAGADTLDCYVEDVPQTQWVHFPWETLKLG